MKRTFIIAEAGINHNGSISIAKKIIDAAFDAKVDAVKFQTFNTELLVSKYARKAEYQKESVDNNTTQFRMLKKLELSEKSHRKLIAYCKKKGIIFLSTPFDLESIDLLNNLGIKIFKIPSGEITDLLYLRKIGALKKNIILSTGMSNLKEIRQALDILIKAGTKKKNITILHCNTAYPTPAKDVNLLAMQVIKKMFSLEVGYSDHTQGIEISIAATALGASVIEKHITLDRNMKGPDHKASLEPGEFKAMVCAIRNIEKALGNGIKKPSPSELKNRPFARKSIIAAQKICKGDIFSKENLTVKRPGTGISPMSWDSVIGNYARKDFSAGEQI